jgi:hypothetical protein
MELSPGICNFQWHDWKVRKFFGWTWISTKEGFYTDFPTMSGSHAYTKEEILEKHPNWIIIDNKIYGKARVVLFFTDDVRLTFYFATDEEALQFANHESWKNKINWINI